MFDPECLVLAVYFLPRAPMDAQHRLAQAIQDTVEAFGNDALDDEKERHPLRMSNRSVEAFGNEEESQQEATHA